MTTGLHTTDILAVHHAGGSARSFGPLRRELGAELALSAYEMPGRGRRSRERYPRDIGEVAADLASHIKTIKPRIIMGVSMGALAAYEACSNLDRPELPALLIAVSANAPTVGVSNRTAPFRSDRPAMSSSLREDGIRAHFSRQLDADLDIVDRYLPSFHRLAMPVDAWWGTDDLTLSYKTVVPWLTLSSDPTGDVTEFAGGHLFPFEQSAPERVSKALRAAWSRVR